MDGNTAYMIIKTDDTKLSFYIFFHQTCDQNKTTLLAVAELRYC